MTTEAPESVSSATGKNRWFQLGLISAGAAAPLIARWRNLRAAEQAEALREQANERWSEALAWMSQARSQDGIQEALRQALPQAQDALRQVAPQAQESLRHVGSAAREALRRAPAAPAPEPAAPVVEVQAASRRKVNTTLWLVGVGVGVVAAGVVAYIVLRNRMSASADDDALVEIPLTAPTSAEAFEAAAAAEVASEGPAIVEETPDEEPSVAEPPHFSDDDAAGAAFIGNILSRVYHPANSKRLPAPQHRIYFASEEEAVEAGYRPDGAEMASRANEPSGQRD